MWEIAANLTKDKQHLPKSKAHQQDENFTRYFVMNYLNDLVKSSLLGRKSQKNY